MDKSLTCNVLSHCCQALLFMSKTPEGTGIFHCQDCSNQCAAMRARSHCCVAPVIVTHEKFPFICTLCEGECELAHPTALNNEEQADHDVLKILRLFKGGGIGEEKAWNLINNIVDREVDDGMLLVADGIRKGMNQMLVHPEALEPGAANLFLGGVDSALAVLDIVIKDLLHDEEKK